MIRPSPHDLKPWRPLGLLGPSRTSGEVMVRKNGGAIDIWLRVNGAPTWVGVSGPELRAFLADDAQEAVVLRAESNGNAESWGPTG